MAGIISIALKAVDQYSGVLMGLNQGFELVSKAIAGIKAAADLAFGAISDGIKMAAKGGDYVELRSQFNNVAQSFGVDGTKILKSLNDISLNMMTLPEAAKLAGRGVAAGLSEKQIATAFEFVKRRTELTGESFTAMSEQVFSALQSGRYSVLKQMGLVVEKGAGIANVMDVMTATTKKYGETGFNAADKLNALAAQQTNFTTAVGVAINQTPIFQKALTWVTDAVVRLVSMFDPRPLSVFLDVFGELFSGMIQSAAAVVPGLDSVFAFIKNLLKGTAADSGTMVLAVSKSIFGIVRSVAEVVNGVMSILTNSGIVTVVEFIVSMTIDTIRNASILIAEILNWIVGKAITGFAEIVWLMRDIAQSYPTISAEIGLDVVALAELEMTLRKAAKGTDDFTAAFGKGVDIGADFAQKLTAGMAGFARKGIDMGAIDAAEQAMNDRIGKIDFSKSWGEALSPKIAPLGIALPEIAKTGISKSVTDAGKLGKDLGNSMGGALSSGFFESTKLDIENYVNKIEAAEYEAGTRIMRTSPGGRVIEKWERRAKGLGEYAGAERAMKKEEEKLEKIAEEKRASELQARLAAQRKEYDLREEYIRREEELRQRNDPLQRVQEFFKAANWPAEMDAFMRVIFAWLISIAGNEPLPLAITTGI